jgi:hypothetical protein
MLILCQQFLYICSNSWSRKIHKVRPPYSLEWRSKHTRFHEQRSVFYFLIHIHGTILTHIYICILHTQTLYLIYMLISLRQWNVHMSLEKGFIWTFSNSEKKNLTHHPLTYAKTFEKYFVHKTFVRIFYCNICSLNMNYHL